MLRIAILDANSKAQPGESFIDSIVSVVGHWLKWECQQVDFSLSPIYEADVILLVHSGQVDWQASCRKALKRAGIEPLVSRRGREPYVITGGPIDVAPFTALKLSNALAIGEAYLFVRQLLDVCKQAQSIDELVAFICEYPHAIEQSQIADYQRDAQSPWLLADVPEPLALPDEWVDWDANVMIRSDDRVIRVIASKGCHLKCKFCATTYRQTYRINPLGDQVLRAMDVAKHSGENIALITNDAADLPFFDDVTRKGQLAFQSLTVKALRNPAVLESVIRAKLKMARFGVEGISERIRQAFGKPISNDELLTLLERLSSSGIDTHIFFIVGSPYENASDWQEFREFHHALACVLQARICRIKLTAFNPQPPTPLSYLIPNGDYYQHTQEFMTWLLQNWKSRHVTFITPRKPDVRIQDLADSFGLERKQIEGLMQQSDTVDLAPTVEYAHRMPWEVVKWPLPVAKRWHLSRSYMKYMGVLDRLHRVDVRRG